MKNQTYSPKSGQVVPFRMTDEYIEFIDYLVGLYGYSGRAEVIRNLLREKAKKIRYTWPVTVEGR